MNNRTFAIGDIHGNLTALKALMSKIKPQETDSFIFLGDYVDRGDSSAQVIDYLIDMRDKYDCIFIKGNHDAWCEEWLLTDVPNSEWLNHGGLSTIKSYEKYIYKAEHWAFFQSLPLYYVDAQKRLFLHAGFTSRRGPKFEIHQPMLYWDRTLWESALLAHKRVKTNDLIYPNRLKLFHEIYIGHTPTVTYKVKTPMNACNVWNVDTGAGLGYVLSALEVETKEVFQSEI